MQGKWRESIGDRLYRWDVVHTGRAGSERDCIELCARRTKNGHGHFEHSPDPAGSGYRSPEKNEHLCGKAGRGIV